MAVHVRLRSVIGIACLLCCSTALLVASTDDEEWVTEDMQSTFPPECENLPSLVAAQPFTPSNSARWASAGQFAAWRDTPPVTAAAHGDGRCDIERVLARDVSRGRFEEAYLEQRPVLLVNATDWSHFAAMTQRQVLLYCFGDFDVTLSTANKNSYDKFESSFRHYVDEVMSEPQSLTASGVGTKYMFGDNRHDEWEALFQHYEKPTRYIFGRYASLSFGVGSSGSGVPFHTHGHVFAEVLHGRKRWFLQAPGAEPTFDPDESSLRWVEYVLPTLPNAEREAILDCVAGPGDLLYIPSHWHHSTLNLGESVFMSTFV